VLKGKRFWDAEDIKSGGGGIWHIFLFRIKKNVLNKGPSAGNIVKNWREITLKHSVANICSS
jgi:hypothetical protein